MLVKGEKSFALSASNDVQSDESCVRNENKREKFGLRYFSQLGH